MRHPTLEETDAFVAELFSGITDKGGKPYVDHCRRVMTGLPEWCSDDARHAALLHDVVEDIPSAKWEAGLQAYNLRVVELVIQLTRPETLTYMEWIQRIADSGDRELIAIKLSDNRDNSDPARIAQLPPDRQGIVKRYARAREILEAAL
jgi:(p)ppGpp synthase/HD superfamily hydrolase